MEDNKTVLDFYQSNNEDGRIEKNPIEFIRTKDIILRNLPEKPIKIIDLCGASGHYAYWLAQMGHEVHLMDLSPKHIEEAKCNKLKYNVELASTLCGDARSLSYNNESFDMVLLMGALYHLQEREDRIKCQREVYRILKNNGIAVFAYCSRYASMLDGFKRRRADDPIYCEIMDEGMSTGKHKNPGNKHKYFTNAFFHSTNDIYPKFPPEKLTYTKKPH